jgi:hypothetical protein
MKPTMAAVTVLALSLSVLMLAGCRASPSQANPSSCCQIVKDALEASRQLKPGAKRRDVERQFYMDGGVQDLQSTRYNFLKCGYLHVQIDFKLAGARENGMAVESPDDTVTKVYVPYLDDRALD